jgi:hypothetical protein
MAEPVKCHIRSAHMLHNIGYCDSNPAPQQVGSIAFAALNHHFLAFCCS